MPRTLVTFVTLILVTSADAGAQEALSKAKALYNNAAYEDALSVLDQSKDMSLEGHQYRALCLMALGRVDDADRAIAVVVATDPFFTPDAREIAPRLVARFNETRRRLLPEIVTRAFMDARALFQSGDRGQASKRFRDVRRLLEDASLADDQALASVRTVTNDFLDLLSAEATLQPTAPAAAPANALATVPDEKPSVAFTPPIPVRQTLPQWRPPNEMTAQRSYSGAVKVTIDANGNVTSAAMARRIHPFYDREVLDAARTWLYKPATRDGKPISSETTVEIRLGGTSGK